MTLPGCEALTSPEFSRVNVHVGVRPGCLLKLPQTEDMPSGDPFEARDRLVMPPAALHSELFPDRPGSIPNEAGRVAESLTCGWWSVRGGRGLDGHDLGEEVVECVLTQIRDVTRAPRRALTTRVTGVRKSDGRIAESPCPAPASDLE